MKHCSIDGCEKPRKARGWCDAHWCRWRRHGDQLAGGPLTRSAPNTGPCSIDDCDKPSKARGWCGMHYERWREHGSPLGGGAKYATPEEAFLARTEPIVGDPAHLLWTGYTDSDGYGALSVNGRMVLAHRYAWTRDHGPIPDGMTIDHVCFERSCVNTEHLRLATHAENTRNLSGPHKDRMHDLQRGVHRSGRKYQASVRHNGTLHHLGTFDTVESASRAAQAKRAILFGEFAGRA